MLESLDWLRALIVEYPHFTYLIVFFSAAFGGEVALITLGFLSAYGFFPVWALAILALIAVFMSDLLWFLIAGTPLAKKIVSHKYTSKAVNTIIDALYRISKGNHILALLFLKLLVGTRILMILFLSNGRLSFKEFSKYNIPAIVFWVLIVLPIGYLSGIGFSYVAEVFQNAYVALGFLVLIIFILAIIEALLKKKLNVEEKSQL